MFSTGGFPPRGVCSRAAPSAWRVHEAAPPDATLYRVFLRDGSTLAQLRRVRPRRGSRRVESAARRYAGRAAPSAAQHSGRRASTGIGRTPTPMPCAPPVRGHAGTGRVRAAPAGGRARIERHRGDDRCGSEAGDGRRGAPERHPVGGGTFALSRQGRGAARQPVRRCHRRGACGVGRAQHRA